MQFNLMFFEIDLRLDYLGVEELGLRFLFILVRPKLCQLLGDLIIAHIVIAALLSDRISDRAAGLDFFHYFF